MRTLLVVMCLLGLAACGDGSDVNLNAPATPEAILHAIEQLRAD